MAKGKSAVEEFRALRAAGKTRADVYETEDVEDIYDVVNEQQWKDHLRKRIDENDFVVDDNGAGYADDGRDESDEHYSSEDEDVPVHSKAGKRKREEERERDAQMNSKIQKFFKKQSDAPPAQKKAKVSVCKLLRKRAS